MGRVVTPSFASGDSQAVRRRGLEKDFSGHRILAYDLTSPRTAWLSPEAKGGVTPLPMHPFETDVLILIR